MKQPVKVFILLVLTCMVIAGCHDQAAKMDPYFIGIWNGTDGTYTYRLSIDQRSNGIWEQNRGGVYQSAQGVARVHRSKLSIGLKSFQIDQYPAQNSTGTWQMNLSGVIYHR